MKRLLAALVLASFAWAAQAQVINPGQQGSNAPAQQTATATGSQLDPAYTGGGGSIVSILKGIWTKLSTLVSSVRFTYDTSSNLNVNCQTGCAGSGGTSSSFGAAFPATGTAAGFSDGTNMQGARVTSAAIGDAATPPTANVIVAQTFGMLWNGATWDRWYGDKTNGAWVNIKSAVGLSVTGTVTANQGGTWTVGVNTWGGGTLGAMANYGTSPGAVLVPGVNAFITNTPAVSQSGTWTVQQGGAPWSVSQSGTWNVGQSGTWTVQPGNTANTTPWLFTISQGGNSATVTGAGALKVDNSAVTQPVSQIGSPWGMTLRDSNGNELGSWVSGVPPVRVFDVPVADATGSRLDAPYQGGGGSIVSILKGIWARLGGVLSVSGSVFTAPSSSPQIAGPTSAAGSAVSSLVLKSAPGNLYNAYCVATAAGWCMIFNSASAPANGSTTAGVASGNLVHCIEAVKMNTNYEATITYNPGPPENFSAGITVVYSSTGCATLTASAVAFIHGMAQ